MTRGQGLGGVWSRRTPLPGRLTSALAALRAAFRTKALLALLLAASALALARGPAAAQEVSAEIWVEPADGKVTNAGSITLEVHVRSNVPIGGMSVNLIYPALRLRASGVALGRSWRDATVPDGMPLSDVLISAQASGLAVTLMAPGEPYPPGEYAVVFLPSVASGPGVVDIGVWKTSTLFGADGKPIPTKLTPAKITISENILPTVEPEVTPIPTAVAEKGLLSLSSQSAALTVGQPLTVRVIARSPLPLALAQTDINFDPQVVQVRNVQVGANWRGAQFVTGPGGRSLAQSINEANRTGLLNELALFLLAGEVAEGESELFTITMIGVGGGRAEISLVRPILGPPTNRGRPLDITVSPLAIEVTGAPLPSPAPSPATDSSAPVAPTVPGNATPGIAPEDRIIIQTVVIGTPQPATTPMPTPLGGGVTAVAIAPLADATVQLSPASTTTKPGSRFELRFGRQSQTVTGPASVMVQFEHDVLQVTGVKPGRETETAGLGVLGGDADSIAEANKTGLLSIGVTSGDGTLRAGALDLAVIEMTAAFETTTFVSLYEAHVLDTSGTEVPTTAGAPAQVEVTREGALAAGAGGGSGGGISWISLVLIGGGVGALIGGTVIAAHARKQMAIYRRKRAEGEGRPVVDRGWVPLPRWWPRAAALTLAAAPIGILGYLVIDLTVHSMPAWSVPGPRELFSNEFTGRFTGGLFDDDVFGLVPAIWGTLLVVVISVGIAFPVALAAAVVSSEFSVGRLGLAMRTVMSSLAGIPPIIYALMAVAFVELIMIPKFAGGFTYSTFDPAVVGSSPEAWPPADVPWNAGALPWSGGGRDNSTLLGGAMLSLLLIPFLMPLLDDAIRAVPKELKQGSMALGANRWHTLRKVTLRAAGPGIIGAAGLVTLKALGDVLIVGLVIAWESPHLPQPLFDVLERTVPLTAASAGALGGVQGSCVPEQCSAGYFAAFLVLGAALVVIVATSVGQRVFKRRLGA